MIGVLHALAGVMDYAGWRLTLGNRAFNGPFSELGRDLRTERPANAGAGPRIGHTGEKSRLLGEMEIGEIRHPALIRHARFASGRAHAGQSHAHAPAARNCDHRSPIADRRPI